MTKAKDVVNNSVIEGTTRVPGHQLVVIISHQKSTDADNSEANGEVAMVT